MENLVELSDGTWVDEEKFVQCFSVLMEAYNYYQSLTSELNKERYKANRLKDKIQNPDEPDAIFNKKALMRKQQQECRDELAIVEEKIADLRPRTESMGESYKALRAKLLHEDFHDDFAVRCISNLIIEGAARDLKTALHIFHNVKYTKEELLFYYEGQKGLDRFKAEQGRAKKRTESLRKELSAYESQTVRNKKAAEDSLLSAQISELMNK